MSKEEAKEKEEILQDFLVDIDCLDDLLPWTEKFNVFDVLKVTRTEIRHSNMLSWLFDPNENHGFGDMFFKGVLQRLVENDISGRYDVFKVLLSDFHSFSDYREWRNIDILIVSSEEKILYAIENKVGSHEHSDQLNRYRNILEREYPDYNKFYIYLTPEGENPSDTINWDVLTYTDIIDVLDELLSRIEVQPEVLMLIKNYIEVVRRDIVDDQQLIDICNRIYNKHKKAFDLIYAYRTDGRTQIIDSVTSTLIKLAEEGEIIYDKSTGGTMFRTEGLNSLIPKLDEPLSSWGDNYHQRYWINLKNGRFNGTFELGGHNVGEKDFEVINDIIDLLKPNDKRREFKYKRVYRTKWFDVSDVDDVEGETEKAVRDIVADLKRMEKELIPKVTQK